jgi:hypothetical protein
VTAPKRERRRLARAELLLHLAVTVERWGKTLVEAGTGEGAARNPSVEEWGRDDPLGALCRTYGLSPADLAQECHRLGDEMEKRALRAGYAEHWDQP